MTAINTIIDTLAYSNQFFGHTLLIKLGGSILNDDQLIKSLCEDLKLLRGAGIRIVLVHGGSKAIKRELDLNHITTEFIDGLRVTPPNVMDIIEMVLCGRVNKLLVRKLNSIGMSAIGLSGSDNSMLQCDYLSRQHGCTGRIKAVNIDAITNVLSFQGKDFGSIPVIAPIGIDDEGQPMNVNADIAACHIANALAVDKLIYLTDQDGIYDNHGQLLSQLSGSELEYLITEGIVTDGMLVKVSAILDALNDKMSQVHMLNGKKAHILIEELFTVQGVGTLCKKDSKIYEVNKG
ncbi:MAG: acetylglutamate kinase [Gammaproteobacteria bacterium]|nr:acetylglutamate kinase [Gammaproteobacteria bacterium]